jgi:hypothetical protein
LNTKQDAFGGNLSAAWLLLSNVAINVFAAKIIRFVVIE